MAEKKYKINDIASILSLAQWEKIKPLTGNEADKYELIVSNQPAGIRLDVRLLMNEQQIKDLIKSY